MFAADNWCIKVDEKTYGPYTSEQLRKFAHEGRLAAWSLVAPAGSKKFRPAKEEPSFASFFGEKAHATTSRAFGRKSLEEKTANQQVPASASLANFVLIFDIVSAGASRAEAAVRALGPAFKIADNVWSVQSHLTATGVRNAVAPQLWATDSLFVIDTTNGRTSWQNYAPEIQSKMSAAWMTTKAKSA